MPAYKTQANTNQKPHHQNIRLLSYSILALCMFFMAMQSLSVAASTSKDTSLAENTASPTQIEKQEARQETIRLYHEKAEQGDAVSQFELGNIYHYGWWGVTTDRQKGISYHKKAAEQGNAKAQYALATLYASYEYDGILKDTKKAQYWLEKAAEQGHAKAQTVLGQMYQSHYFSIPPNFTPPDFEKATYWLEKAAKQGNSRALNLLRIVPRSGGKYRQGTAAEYAAEHDAREEETRLLNIQAEKGDILAQFELANIYNHPQSDEKKALYWYKQAAEQGHAPAMHSLSDMYRLNYHIKGLRDVEKGMAYLAQAAEKGDINSQFRLGFIYLKGDEDIKGNNVIPQDFKKAAKYLEQAAKQGHSNAAYNLGVLYAEGKGVVKDTEKAEYYILKSGKDYGSYTTPKTKYTQLKEKAEQGDARAQYDLATIYYGGSVLTVPRDLQKVRYWLEQIAKQYEQAKKQGEDFSASLAQATLGGMYRDGEGGEKDIDKAIYWFEQADLNGDVSAPYELGVIFGYTDKGKQDIPKAILYFEKAAKSSMAFASRSWIELGLIYEFNKGKTQQDYTKAREYYKLAADSGSTQGQINLGSLYYEGKGVTKNFKKALELWEKAAEQGHPRAQLSLGIMYLRAEGVKKNLTKSVSWFRKAAHQGDVSAMHALGAALEYGEGVQKNIPEAYGYLLVILRLNPNAEHLENLEKLQTHLRDEYQLSPKHIKEAEAFAAKLWQDIGNSPYKVTDHQH